MQDTPVSTPHNALNWWENAWWAKYPLVDHFIDSGSVSGSKNENNYIYFEELVMLHRDSTPREIRMVAGMIRSKQQFTPDADDTVTSFSDGSDNKLVANKDDTSTTLPGTDSTVSPGTEDKSSAIPPQSATTSLIESHHPSSTGNEDGHTDDDDTDDDNDNDDNEDEAISTWT